MKSGYPLCELLPPLLALVAALGGCVDNDRCFTTPTIQCQSDDAITVTGSSRISVSCPPLGGWDGAALVTVSDGCGTDTSYWADVVLPSGAGSASYALPSPDLRVEAAFYLRTLESPLTTQFGTLKLIGNSVVVRSRSAKGVDADLDLELDSNAGERFSIVGHVLKTDCTTSQTTSCNY